MSAPTQVIQRRDLSDLVKEFNTQDNMAGFVGLGIMPKVDVVNPDGNYPVINKEALTQDADVKRSNRGAYNRVDFGFEQANFSLEEYGLEIPVDDALAKNYDSYFRAEAEAQDIVLDILAKKQEVRIRDIVEGQNANAVGTSWSTSATATPRADVLAGQKAVRDLIGTIPTKMTMTWDKFQEILITAEFMDSAKYTSNVLALGLDAQISLVKSYLGLSSLNLSYGVLNTADEGQDFSGAGIWDDTKAFLQVEPAATIAGGPNFGHTLNWAADEVVNTESYEEPQTRSNILRTRHWRSEKVKLAEAGYLLSNL